ncbi:MAG: glycosyltransferase [Syntrophaceae bacterium]|nr:glycosyltransferase [Syntrophaceae bacterium]
MALALKIPILFLCDEIKQATAGSEQHLSFLLRNLPRERLEVHFALLRGDEKLPAGFSPVEPAVLNFHSFRNPLEITRVRRSLRQMVRQRSIKVLHVFFRDSELLSSMANLFSLGCRRVLTRRSMGYEDRFWFRRRNRLSALFEAHYVVNSEAIKRHLISCEHVAPKRITVIFNPVNQDRLAEGRGGPSPSELGGIENGDLVVGIVANIRPVKDYETFLKAAARVADRVAEAKFLVIGSADDHYWKKLRPLIENAKLRSRIVFAGAVPNPMPFIRRFDVGVLSSTSEGLSNSLIEYAAAGVATVATDVGGNREIVEDGLTGFLVPAKAETMMADRIVDLLQNPEKRRAMGKRARASAQTKFAQEGILNQYLAFYESLA